MLAGDLLADPARAGLRRGALAIVVTFDQVDGKLAG
jgi:hypothetical protein